MVKKKTPMVFFDVSIDGDPFKRMVFELFSDAAPKIAKNFRALCTGASSFDNTTSPLPYVNSPRFGTYRMNPPSPQQQTLQQQHQPSHGDKMMQLSPQQQQQILAQQQFRQTALQGLGQNQLPHLHDMQAQKFQSFALGGGNPQRAHPSPMLSDPMFNMGANPASMMGLPQQQQQEVPQGAFGNMPLNTQNLESNMAPLQKIPLRTSKTSNKDGRILGDDDSFGNDVCQILSKRNCLLP